MNIFTQLIILDHLTMKKFMGVYVALFLAILAVIARPALDAHAVGDINVNTTVDEFGGGPDCSLREAIQSANTDSNFGGCVRSGTPPYTINIPAGTYILAIPGTGEQGNTIGDLDIDTDLTINGAGASVTILDSGAIERMFDIISAVNVNINDVTIQNGNALGSSGGGLRNIGGTVSITGSVISNNTVTNVGGGIYNASNGTLNISASTISANTTTLFSGGGIYSIGSTLNISASIISGNTADDAGGGIYSTQGTMTISNSAVSTNTATNFSGGGIFNFDSPITISNSTVTNNTTGTNGGGIFNNLGTMTITNSDIPDNTANADGGGIYNIGGPVTITGSTVLSNTASADGGGMFNEGTVTINNSAVSNNQAATSGGGIYNNLGTMTIIDSSITANQTISSGGGGIVNLTTMNLSNTTIANNTAALYGGGIWNTGSGMGPVLNISNSAISGNTAQSNTLGGGGIIQAFGIMNIANSTISGNDANTNGGGIFNFGGTTNSTNITLTDNIADADSDGVGNGGGISRFNGVVNIKSNIIAGNFDTPNNAGPSAGTPDIDGDITSAGYNFIGNIGSTFFNTNTTGDQYGDPLVISPPNMGATQSDTPIDPLLGPLTGSPAYHPLQPFSPAIDQISVMNCTFLSGGINPLFNNGDPVTTDQPGTTRPLEGDLDGTPECDVGAVEFNEPALALIKLVDDPFPRLGQTITYILSMANLGPAIAGPGIISDTQPTGLIFGPATVDSTIAPTINPPPQLATDLVILGGEIITLTLPAIVNISDTVITNIAEVSATNASSAASHQIDITVGRQPCPLLGTDGFGYTCVDSIDPGGPAFAFEDIASPGSIVLNNNDDEEADVSLPFPFTFYDVTSTDLTVGMNGAVVFGQTGQEIPATNLALDDVGLIPNYMIAPFWDDLDDFPGNASSAVYAAVRGSAPDRRFIIQWEDIPHYDDTGGGTLQLILYEGSNEILFQYQDVGFGSASFDDGNSASVGIRGDSTGNSLPYSFDERLIKDGLAIRFIPPLVNLALTKTVDDDQPRLGQTITYTITVENVAPGMNIDDGIISDTIPAGLTFVGPVTLDPSGAGTTGAPPQIVSNLSITNGHTITLTFPALVNTADTVITNTAEVSASNAVVTATGEVPIFVGPQPCPILGADDFGYTCLDSNDPGGPVFAFEDISGTGSQLIFADNDNGEADIFAMPFNFTYYDITANALTVGIDGAIIFGQTGQAISLANLALDSPATPNYMIAPFWDNLDNDPGVGGGVFFETRGTAPNRRFIIQWQDVPHNNDVGTATFQLILFEGSNEILFQYQDVDFGDPALDDGNNASVGIRGNNIDNALPYARNEILIKSGLAIRFFPPATNLVITKTAFSTTVEPGDPLTYTITFSNQGADIATDVVITDQLPVSLTNINVTNSGATITDTGAIPAFVWEVQDLQPGQDGIITITAQIDPLLTSGGLFTNTATIDTSSIETDILNNTDEAGVTIEVEADLVITKMASPTTVKPGDAITYTITFSNQGADIATDVVITDQIPVSLTNVNVVSSGVTITDTGTMPAFVWEVQDLQPGQGGAITITAQIDPGLTSGGLFTNTATIDTTSVESDTLNNEAGAGITIEVEADLVITKLASPTTVEPGDPITYTITFGNQGTGVASDVVITDQLPVSLTNVNVVSSDAAITDTGVMPAFVWEVQDLQPGQGGTITITAQISPNLTSDSSFTNTTIISTTSVESDTLNNEAEAGVNVEVVADLVIDKLASPTTVEPGDPITYTITFSNQGTGVASDVVITDQLPVSLTNVNVVSSGVAITDTGGTPFIWEVQDLQPGQGGTITITAQISPNLTSGGLFTNTATIDTTSVEADTLNNEAEAGVNVEVVADLVIDKLASPTTAEPSDPITYTITFSNQGTDIASDVVITDQLPVSLTNVNVISSGVAITDTGGTPFIWEVQDLQPGQSGTITITALIDPLLTSGGLFTNTATIDTTSVEADTLNNEAEAGVTIILPDLTIAKTVSPTIVALGDPITFTLTFSNQGTSVATNISIFDTLPVTLTSLNVVSSGVAITDTGGTPFAWEVQDLQPGQGGTITITGQIDNLTSLGLFTNTAVIFTPGPDSDPSNDTAETGFTVTASSLILTKSVNETNPDPGEVITYTITVQNVGTTDAIGAVISDTLPLSLTLAGPVILDPPSAGTPGAPPLLATNVTITAGQSITITLPVTVSAILNPGTVITNTAAVTSLVVTTPETDSVTITVGPAPAPTSINFYLPFIVKDQ